MSFTSLVFLFVFLPLSVAGYFLLGRIGNRTWPKVWLLAISLVFYSGGRLVDLPVLLCSILANCLIGAKLVEQRGYAGMSHRTLMVAGIAANVLFLCTFKYAGFFSAMLNRIMGTALPTPDLVFPLGISFFTIQQIMFLVDCYEGLVDGHNWLDYLVFAGFFPYVTMGPIVRWKQVAPQLNDPQAWRLFSDNIAKGLYLLVVGLFKKVVLADSFFRWADAGFSYSQPLSLIGGWLAAVSFAFQLYFDFSGYTDMAIGGALMFNVTLPQNFDEPFRATSITEFWRRWHITLTAFITTYLYTPLLRATSKVTFSKGLLATFLSMLIAGFWHGPNWTFLVFGGIHGAALVIAQCWRKMKLPMPNNLGWLLTFTVVVCSLVFFRSASISRAAAILTSMFSVRGGLFDYEPWTGIDRVDHLMGGLWMICGVLMLLRGRNSLEMQRAFRPSWAMVALCVAVAVIDCTYANGVVSRSFVYRDF